MTQISGYEQCVSLPERRVTRSASDHNPQSGGRSRFTTVQRQLSNSGQDQNAPGGGLPQVRSHIPILDCSPSPPHSRVSSSLITIQQMSWMSSFRIRGLGSGLSKGSSPNSSTLLTNRFDFSTGPRPSSLYISRNSRCSRRLSGAPTDLRARSAPS